MLLNPLLLQLLVQQGKGVNPEPVLRKLWTDGLGNRNFDQLIISVGGMPPSIGAPPGMSPGTPPEQSQEQQSMAMQADNADAMSENMVPGEGDEAGMMRDNANMMAAMMGGGMGSGGGM